MLCVIGPVTTPLSIISSFDVPDNFDMSDADNDPTKGANSEMLITDKSASAKRASHAKPNAEGILYMHKKQRSSSSSISSELVELSLKRKEQPEEDKHYKIVQCKFKAESEWEERKIRMLE